MAVALAGRQVGGRQTDRHAGRQGGRQTCRQAGRQAVVFDASGGGLRWQYGIVQEEVEATVDRGGSSSMQKQINIREKI